MEIAFNGDWTSPQFTPPAMHMNKLSIVSGRDEKYKSLASISLVGSFGLSGSSLKSLTAPTKEYCEHVDNQNQKRKSPE